MYSEKHSDRGDTLRTRDPPCGTRLAGCAHLTYFTTARLLKINPLPIKRSLSFQVENYPVALSCILLNFHKMTNLLMAMACLFFSFQLELLKCWEISFIELFVIDEKRLKCNFKAALTGKFLKLETFYCNNQNIYHTKSPKSWEQLKQAERQFWFLRISSSENCYKTSSFLGIKAVQIPASQRGMMNRISVSSVGQCQGFVSLYHGTCTST